MVSHKLENGSGTQNGQDVQVKWTTLIDGRLIGPAVISTPLQFTFIVDMTSSRIFFKFWSERLNCRAGFIFFLYRNVVSRRGCSCLHDCLDCALEFVVSRGIVSLLEVCIYLAECLHKIIIIYFVEWLHHVLLFRWIVSTK